MTFSAPSIAGIVDPPALDVPGDTRYLGDRLDRLIHAVEGLGIRQEVPAASQLYAQTPGTGRNDFPQTVRARLRDLTLSVSAACTVTVRIGNGVTDSFDFAGATTIVLPFMRVIDPGTDVVVTASAGSLRNAYFTGWTDN